MSPTLELLLFSPWLSLLLNSLNQHLPLIPGHSQLNITVIFVSLKSSVISLFPDLSYRLPSHLYFNSKHVENIHENSLRPQTHFLPSLTFWFCPHFSAETDGYRSSCFLPNAAPGVTLYLCTSLVHRHLLAPKRSLTSQFKYCSYEYVLIGFSQFAI